MSNYNTKIITPMTTSAVKTTTTTAVNLPTKTSTTTTNAAKQTYTYTPTHIVKTTPTIGCAPTPTINNTKTPTVRITPTPTIKNSTSITVTRSVSNVANKVVDSNVNNCCGGVYTKKSLLEHYEFTEKEISTYFKKRAIGYSINSTVVFNIFPGSKITNAKELKDYIELGSKVAKSNLTSKYYINNLSNKNVSKSELGKYLDELSLYLKKEMHSNFKSYDFIDQILGFAKNIILNEAGNSSNIKTILTKFSNYVKELVGETKLNYTYKKALSKKEVNLFDTKGKISASDFYSKTDKIINNGNLQAKFIAQILKDTFKSLNLTEVEKEAFTQKIIDCVAKKIGTYNSNDSKNKLVMSKINRLDANGDGSWLQEFTKIVQNEASKINPNINRNPKIINGKELTNILGNLSPEKFYENLNDYILSDDAGIRKFATMIAEATDKATYCKEDAIEYIGYIFSLMNNKAGVTDSLNLKAKTVARLNNKDIFKTLDNILKSNTLSQLYRLGYDGQIDEFDQGNIGDCWLLSGIISLQSSIQGRDILSDAVTYNSDLSATVNFKGVGVSYKISAEEIIEALESKAYSRGDTDVIILELATEKLRKDIASGKVKIKEGHPYSYTGSENHNEKGGAITSGYTEQFIYFLTGNTSQSKKSKNINTYLSESEINKFLLNYLKDFKNGNVALSFGCYYNTHSATTVDGKTVKANLGNIGHAFSIVGMTNDTITIVNPWESGEKYTLTWKEFAKFGISSITASPLT